MGFTRKEITRILKDNGVETIPSTLLSELCDAHIETMDAIIEEKYVSKKEYDSVSKELETEKSKEPQKVDVKETEEYKELSKQFDEYKVGIETETRNNNIKSLKKAELEKIGLKGSALNLVLDSNKFELEINEDGTIKKESLEAFTKDIQDNHKDLITVEKTKEGTPPQKEGEKDTKVTGDTLKKMSFAKMRELKKSNPDAFKNLNENS